MVTQILLIIGLKSGVLLGLLVLLGLECGILFACIYEELGGD
jgi:hypothetical protein